MLPPLIEYLASQERPGGFGHLLSFGMGQVEIPYFPSGSSINYTISPPEGIYAQLYYRSVFQAVPDTFFGYINQAGNMAFQGSISQRVVNEGLDMMLFAMVSRPVLTSLTNVSGMFQAFQHTIFFLNVVNEADMNLARDIIKEFGGQQAKTLLEKINDKLGMGALSNIFPKRRS